MDIPYSRHTSINLFFTYPEPRYTRVLSQLTSLWTQLNSHGRLYIRELLNASRAHVWTSSPQRLIHVPLAFIRRIYGRPYKKARRRHTRVYILLRAQQKLMRVSYTSLFSLSAPSRAQSAHRRGRITYFIAGCAAKNHFGNARGEVRAP